MKPKTFYSFLESASNYELDYLNSLDLNFVYTTPMGKNEIDIFHGKSDVMDIECYDAKVEWGIYIDNEKNIGVSALRTIVKRVYGTYKITTYDELGEEIGDEDKEFEFNYTQIKTDVDFGNRDDYSRFHIFPSKIDIRYDENKCEVYFY